MSPTGSALALTFVVTLAGCTSSGAHPSPAPTSSATASRVALQPCPHRVPAAIHDTSAPADMLVTPNPARARLCRYDPLFGSSRHGVPHGTLYGQAHLEAAAAQRLAADLNAIPQLAAGERIACPVAFGTRDLLLFAYADGHMLSVLMWPDGCPSFTNGRYRSGDFSPGFVRYLKVVNRFVPPKLRAGATSAG